MQRELRLKINCKKETCGACFFRWRGMVSVIHTPSEGANAFCRLFYRNLLRASDNEQDSKRDKKCLKAEVKKDCEAFGCVDIIANA
jgi:hypothetical protein